MSTSPVVYHISKGWSIAVCNASSLHHTQHRLSLVLVKLDQIFSLRRPPADLPPLSLWFSWEQPVITANTIKHTFMILAGFVHQDDLQQAANRRHHGHMTRTSPPLRVLLQVFYKLTNVQVVKSEFVVLFVVRLLQASLSGYTFFRKVLRSSLLLVFRQQITCQIVRTRHRQPDKEESRGEVCSDCQSWASSDRNDHNREINVHLSEQICWRLDAFIPVRVVSEL